MKKTRLLGAVCAGLTTISMNVHAAVISGTHVLSNGNTVELSGLEWLDWESTEDMSRTTVESQLLPGGTLEGWRYATRAEFEALFDSLWGGTHENWHTSNVVGGDWLATNFGESYADGGTANTGSDVFFGADGECSTDPGSSCTGHWRGDGLTVAGEGWFDDYFGLSVGVGATNNNAEALKTHYFGYQSALVRQVATVPIPAAIWLFGSGLLGLIGVARRKVRV